MICDWLVDKTQCLLCHLSCDWSLTANTLSTWSLAVCSSIIGSEHFPIMSYIAVTISVISSLVITPSPSMSYRENAHFSLSWSDPRDSTDKPITNCWKGKMNFMKIIANSFLVVNILFALLLTMADDRHEVYLYAWALHLNNCS